MSIRVRTVKQGERVALGVLASILAIIAALVSIFGVLFPNMQAGFTRDKHMELSAPALFEMREAIANATDKVSSLILLEEYDSFAHRLYIKAGYRVKNGNTSLLVVSIALFFFIVLVYAVAIGGIGGGELFFPLLVELLALAILWFYAWLRALYNSVTYLNRYRKAIKELREEIAPTEKRKRLLKETLDFRAIKIGLTVFGVCVFVFGMFVQRFLHVF